MTTEIIIERLTYIKYLFQLGEQQAQQPNIIAFSSILCFHDAIDLFNQLSADYLNKSDKEKKAASNKNSNKLFMMEYFDLIPELTLKPYIKRINDRRNALKHNGEIPSSISIEESKVTTRLFLEENTESIFKLNFDDISLISLVQNSEVLNFLKQAEIYLKEENFSKTAEEAAKAFFVLTYIDPSGDYWEDDLKYYLKKRIRIPNIPNEARSLGRDFENTFKIYNDNLETLSGSLLIISLGIDYRKFAKFELFTPRIGKKYIEPVEYFAYYNSMEKKLNAENCKFLISFVLDCALKVQTFN